MLKWNLMECFFNNEIKSHVLDTSKQTFSVSLVALLMFYKNIFFISINNKIDSFLGRN